MPAQESFTKAAKESGSDLPQPGTSQDCIWVSLSAGNAGKLKELLYSQEEHTRESALRSSMVTLGWHIVLLDLEITHTEGGWTLQSWPRALTALQGCCMHLSVHGHPQAPCPDPPKASQAAQLSQDWAGSTCLCSGKCPFSVAGQSPLKALRPPLWCIIHTQKAPRTAH